MARTKLDKNYKSFAKGLITEATGLTFPDSSCRDLDNVDIEISGSVRRRLGVGQEVGGQVIGAGTLTDTLYSNSGGGPLSSNQEVVASSQTDFYDGVTGNGDWSFGQAGTGVFDGVVVGGGQFTLRGQNGQTEYMTQDFDVFGRDVLTFDMDFREDTNNENVLVVVLGGASGAGLCFGFDNDSPQKVVKGSTSGYLTGAVSTETLLTGINFGIATHVSIQMVKTAVNTYFGTILLTQGASIVGFTSYTHSFVGDEVSIFTSGTTNSFARWRVDNVRVSQTTFATGTDLPDVTVEQYATAVSTHQWTTPNGDGTAAIQVFQIGNELHFRNAREDSVSPASEPYEVSIRFDGVGTGYLYNCTQAEAAKVKLQSTVGQGRIWFTSQAVVPFYAELDPDTQAVSIRAVGALDGASGIDAIVGKRVVRDLVGMEDGTDPSVNPAALSQEHLYNLLNQGWPSDKINDYFTAKSNYPSNSQQWFRGKNDTDDFDPDLLTKQEFGTSNAPKGRLFYDALVGQRDGVAHTVTGVASPLNFSGAQDLKASTGWETVAFIFGRLWFAGEVNPKRPSGLYFTKTLESPSDAGKFYQQNDPTSEYLNDLLATDGGFIAIPEAGNIRRLQPFGSGLLVLADNGVWFVYGRSDGFAANNYSREKLSSTGIIGSNTVVDADTAIYFWAQNSVHRVMGDAQNRNALPIVQDIGQTTIFRYYTLIPREAREAASSVYDPVSKKVYWFWLSTGEAADHRSIYDRALIFDTRTEAFTKYSFPVDMTPLFGIGCAFPKAKPTQPVLYETITTLAGVLVTDSLGDALYAAEGTALDASELTNSLKLVIVSGSESALRLAEFSSLDFFDFEGFSNFSSEDVGAYVITGDETMDDLQRKKQATYVHSFFERTENGFYSDLTPKRASKCLVSGHWDWHTSNAGNRWSPTQVAYRLRRPYTPVNANDTFDTGESIVYTKVKMRGQGRALAIKYESVEGYDFRLSGFSIPFTADEV